MFNGNNIPSLSDIAAVTKNSDNGWGDGNGWWILIILFALFGWGGNGWGNNGGGMNSTAAAYTDSALQRGFDTQSIIGKLDGINNGLCDGFYAMNTGIMQGTNALQQAINANSVANMQNTNALQTQIAQCCCDNRYEALQNANTTQNLVSKGFADIGYQNATDTCTITTAIANQTQQIMQNDNANYRALHDELVQSQIDAKDAKIAEQASIIQSLNLAQSQANQNTYLINALKPTPIPAFSAANLYGGLYGTGNCTACNGTIGF